MEEKESTITPETRYSGRLFWVTIVAVFSAGVWAARLDLRLESIEKELIKKTQDRWTGSDMTSWSIHLQRNSQDWVNRLSQDNPSLKVTPITIPDTKYPDTN